MFSKIDSAVPTGFTAAQPVARLATASTRLPGSPAPALRYQWTLDNVAICGATAVNFAARQAIPGRSWLGRPTYAAVTENKRRVFPLRSL